MVDDTAVPAALGSLPTELLEFICDSLAKDDLKSLRQCSRKFNVFATCRITQNIAIDTNIFNDSKLAREYEGFLIWQARNVKNVIIKVQTLLPAGENNIETIKLILRIMQQLRWIDKLVIREVTDSEQLFVSLYYYVFRCKSDIQKLRLIPLLEASSDHLTDTEIAKIISNRRSKPYIPDLALLGCKHWGIHRFKSIEIQLDPGSETNWDMAVRERIERFFCAFWGCVQMSLITTRLCFIVNGFAGSIISFGIKKTLTYSSFPSLKTLEVKYPGSINAIKALSRDTSRAPLLEELSFEETGEGIDEFYTDPQGRSRKIGEMLAKFPNLKFVHFRENNTLAFPFPPNDFYFRCHQAICSRNLNLERLWVYFSRVEGFSYECQIGSGSNGVRRIECILECSRDFVPPTP